MAMTAHPQRHNRSQRRTQSRPPIARPTPPPLPDPSVKEIGDAIWKVTLPPNGQWFDTGIPVVCNTVVQIKDFTADRNHKWMVKLGGNVFYSQVTLLMQNSSEKDFRFVNSAFNRFDEPVFQMYVREDNQYGPPYMIVDYDFEDTIKLKVDDEGKYETLYLKAQVFDETSLDSMKNNESHMALHKPHMQWFQDMKRKLTRE
jgi:hypothetical protein